MRKIDAPSFWLGWKKKIPWKKDSRLAVLFTSDRDWELLPKRFTQNFGWYYQLMFFSVEETDILTVEKESGPDGTGWDCLPTQTLRRLEEMRQWEPQYLLAVGSYDFLQCMHLLRERFLQTLPCLFLSDGDRFELLAHEEVWLRGRGGETRYRTVLPKREEDFVVAAGGRDDFWRELQKRKKEMFGQGRDVCDELAEPLSLVYGVPLAVGNFFALCFLYRHLSPEGQVSVPKKRKQADCPADWRLAGLALRCRPGVAEGFVLPGRDVALLTEMAMQGMDRQPESVRCTREQVQAFYRELCR